MAALILASTSPYRRELLLRLGLPFSQVAHACDEERMKDPKLGARMLAQLLAREKALSIAALGADDYVLGSDQLVEVDGEILGKPGSAERAVAQLARLQGRAHRLVTAFAIVTPDGAIDEHVDVHTLHMRPLSRVELERYVAHDRPYDCAGSYKIESRGIALFERIEGSDFSAIMGLPLIALTTRLRRYGFELP
jgi:septum formation protein